MGNHFQDHETEILTDAFMTLFGHKDADRNIDEAHQTRTWIGRSFLL